MLQSHICTPCATRIYMARAHMLACMYESHRVPISSNNKYIKDYCSAIVVQYSFFFLWSTNRAQTARSHRHEAVYTLFFFLFPLSRLTSRDGGVHDAIKFDSRAERGAICCLYSRRVRYRDTP